MHTGLEGKHDRGEAFAIGVLGCVGGLRPRYIFLAQGRVERLANQCTGSYILFTHMIAQRRKVMRGKAVDRRS